MSTSPGPLLQALEGLWDRLQAEHAELPPVRISVSPTPVSASHPPERWRKAAEDPHIVTGLVVSADTMREGEEAVVTDVLHQAAHLLNWTRNITDTTVRGAYHNNRFLEAAQELGLYWPTGRPRISGRGYATPELTEGARSRHEQTIKELTDAIPRVLPHLVAPTPSRTRAPDRLTLECGCDEPRKIKISPTVAALGSITCGVCGQNFR
ncbi:hypothetical protein [Streptomyces sp. EN16]|uniref:hypothetical protein n=1 Tax=Streptomyces sp. EN16 TaxID=212773 RepID=UPI00085212C8|nr:hypothetical protein [Streptomyces sp. EN16]